MAKEKIDIFMSNLVPAHEILSEDHKKKLLEKLGIKKNNLPKINQDDPAVKILEAKKGDVIKIIRNSHTADESLYYRVVS